MIEFAHLFMSATYTYIDFSFVINFHSSDVSDFYCSGDFLFCSAHINIK